MAKKLTDKQKAFVEAYLKTLNATEAARLAGYNATYESLRRIGSQNLTKPKVREEIDLRLGEMVMSANEVLERLSQQASGEYSEFMTSYGTLDLKKLIAEGKGHLIKRIKKDATGIDIWFYDSQKALELLGKYHSLFTEKQEHSGEIRIRIVRGNVGSNSQAS